MIKSWSYSRYKDYATCPFKAKLKHVDGMREPANKAMERGSAIHKQAELFLLGEVKSVPEEFGFYAKQLKVLKARPGMKPEDQWGFDAQWNISDWRSAKCRMVVDVQYEHARNKKTTLVILDWKTGKIYDDHAQQRSLYAMGGMYRFPHVDRVECKFVYVDQQSEAGDVFEREELPDITAVWQERVRAMMVDTIFAPRPGRHCGWCAFAKKNGGPCEF